MGSVRTVVPHDAHSSTTPASSGLTSTTPHPIASPDAAPAQGLVPDSVRWLAWFLDDAVPFVGKRRIGADGFLSFIPGIGDAAGFGLSAVVVLAGIRSGCSWVTVVRMAANALLESLIGLIPGIGAAFAFVWKSNNRNLRIIERDLADREATRRESWKVLIAMLVFALLTVAIFIAGIALFVWIVLDWLFA